MERTGAAGTTDEGRLERTLGLSIGPVPLPSALGALCTLFLLAFAVAAFGAA